MKRAALYVRVSTAEQRDKGLSVDSQIAALKQYCADNGFDIAGIYNDAGISARKKYTNRPALLQLIQDCKAGKVDLILFTKLDRWFRSVSNYYTVQEQLDSAKVPWRAIWEDYETETSAGIFKVNIMLSVAQAESDRTSERIKAVREYERAQGYLCVYRAPVGYIRANKTLEYDPETRDAVQAFFNTYLTEFNTARAMEAAHAKGLSLNRKRAHHMLHSGAYYGDYYGVTTPTYITPEQHELIEKASAHYTRKPKDQQRIFIFTGIVFCTCGARMSAHCVKYHSRIDGHTNDHNCYVCSRYLREVSDNRIHAQLSEKKIEKYLLNNLDSLIASLRFELSMDNGEEHDYAADIAKQEAKLNRLKEIYIDGDIVKNEYIRRASDIRSKIAELKAKEAPAQTLPELPDDWIDMYSTLSPSGKRAFWRNTLKRIIIEHNEIVHIDFL